MYKLLDSAIAFAAQAHAGQVRKYDGLPYVTHTIEVMRIVHEIAEVKTEEMLCASVLHDVVEDTPFTIATIERRFGAGVAALVFDLTDQFTSEAYPDMNRLARKAAEAVRMATISPQAQTIKYADLISNTASIVPNDPGFARTYLREKDAILKLMVEGDRRLREMACKSLTEAQTALMHLTLTDDQKLVLEASKASLEGLMKGL